MPDMAGGFNLSSSYLFASLLWGAIGAGMAVFGKKQKSFLVLGAGLALIAVSYFISSAVYMSLASIAIIGLLILLKRQGYD